MFISRCQQITDISYLNSLSQLQILNISDVSIPPQSLSLTMEHLGQLRAIILNGARESVDDNLLLAITKSVEKLKLLAISGCSHVTDHGLVPLVKKFGNHLNTLKICETKATDKTIQVTFLVLLRIYFFIFLGYWRILPFYSKSQHSLLSGAFLK